MKKKIRYKYFFYNFPVAGNEKKKMKNEKKNGADLSWATAQIILQERTLYCEINRCWIVLQHGVG